MKEILTWLKKANKEVFVIRRPAMWAAIVLLISFIIFNHFSESQVYKRDYKFDDLLKNSEKIAVNINGQVESVQSTENSVRVILKHVEISFNLFVEHDNTADNYLPYIAIYVQELTKNIDPGNKINCQASLMNIKTATNPGEFDLRQYYREKKIYYMAVCNNSDLTVSDNTSKPVKTYLLKLRNKIKNIYTQCLPEKEAGTVCAMLLGDKSIMDNSIKELYRQNGIGHLLAISGLHITILCMALKKILFKLKVNQKLSVILIVIFLLLYGTMTEFGVSTSRAVIMMILALIAQVSGRSYDMLSAMSVSAVIIVIQKPFAFFSCSFMLSYGAIIAIAVIYPFLIQNLMPDKDLLVHKNKERLIDYIRIEIIKSLIMSFSIQFFTLPLILYFYYETPTYGLILNIIILPFSNILVIFGAVGGILGLFFLPLGKFFLGVVYMILNIFEKSCMLFRSFPFHTIVTGRPKLYNIFIFYVIILALLIIFRKNKPAFIIGRIVNTSRYIIPVLITLLIFVLIPVKNNTFNISFLDIGQGDCIIIKSESGMVYMIDGGSSSKKDIGKNIIVPYLKYHGITKIDYCIITHSDSDHISGIVEILEQRQDNMIQIDEFLIPNPDETLKDENYNKILQLAENNSQKVSYIKKFDIIKDQNLKIVCVHPENGYRSDSANAYSTVLSIEHGSQNILLTGDLEGEGETQVLETLNNYKNIFPDSYTVLKAAHHGSKNSTSDEFLKRVKPQLTVISCGRNNKYGHPHAEFLSRLQKTNTILFRTDTDGAIILP